MTGERPTRESIDVFGLTHMGKVRAENQDHFLIASLHKTMNVIQTSLALLRHGSAESAARGLVDLALSRGGSDNMTLVVGRLNRPST